MSIILEASHIHKSYGKHHVLQGVDLQIEKGSIFGLLGPNGAGKSTLIRILTGITAQDEGFINFSSAFDAAHRSRQIGYLPEERGLYRKMKVWEQAVYLTQLKGLDKSEAVSRLREWFERLDMMPWWKQRTDELSKGMQQKLQFVITVACNPTLLILDEPFSGFDPVNAEEIKREILRLKSNGTTVVFSTHNMASVEELCDDISLLNKGKIVLAGQTQSVRESFGSDLFEVHFKGSHLSFAHALGYLFEIDAISDHGSLHKASVRSHSKEGSNHLLKALTEHVEVVRFEQKIPSMHDIFIAQVNETSALDLQSPNAHV
jgi:ABC-2 type transport system ATP-binding protein